MLHVASIWRVSVLIVPLAVMVGCDWIPVRRRVDPALYPIPNRPDPDLIRGRRPVLSPASVRDPGPGTVARPSGARGEAVAHRLPPLPDLVPVSPEEILAQSAPTPLLDGELQRAEAVQPSRIDDPVEEDGDRDAMGIPLVGPTLPIDIELEPVPTPIADPISDGSAAQGTSNSIDLPPIPGESDTTPEMAREADDSGSNGPADDPDLAAATGDPEPAEGEAGTDDEAPAIPEEFVDQSSPGDQFDRDIAPGVDDRAGTEPLPTDDGTWMPDGPDDEATRWQVMMELLAGAEKAESSDTDEAPAPALRITRAEFCREILGFDRIDPIAPRTLEAGERTLIYCEVEGVDYLPEHDAFTSRLETTLEILPDAPTEVARVVLWREYVTSEDRCSRPRHDYFVGYLLTVPSTVVPGPHLLRVTQRDPRSGIETVAELPFEVVSPSDRSAPRFQ